MLILLDTSILVRWADPADARHPVVMKAMDALVDKGHEFRICPQCITEFHAVATRPVDKFGLGFSFLEAVQQRNIFELKIAMLHEIYETHGVWKTIVGAGQIVGKTVHDARLLATAAVHRVSAIMTTNLSHFNTLARQIPNFHVIDPVAV